MYEHVSLVVLRIASISTLSAPVKQGGTSLEPIILGVRCHFSDDGGVSEIEGYFDLPLSLGAEGDASAYKKDKGLPDELLKRIRQIALSNGSMSDKSYTAPFQ